MPQHPFSADHDAVYGAAILAVDELMQRIIERHKVETGEIQEDNVRLRPHLEARPTALQLHRRCTVIVDESAATKLQGANYYRWVFANEPEWQEFQ